MPADVVHCGGDGARGIRCGVAVVHRDGVALVFHRYPADTGEPLGELGCRIRQYRDRLRCSLVAVVHPVRTDHLKAVAAGVPQAGYADPIADVGEVAAGEHRYRVERGQRSQGIGGAVNQGGCRGLIDDL